MCTPERAQTIIKSILQERGRPTDDYSIKSMAEQLVYDAEQAKAATNNELALMATAIVNSAMNGIIT